MTSVLEVKNLDVSFRTRDGNLSAVCGCSLSVEAGKVTAVVGESGCGKSVTALAIMGLLGPKCVVRGNILFMGDPVRGIKNLKGNGMSMIFQEPMTSLNPVQTVGRQVSEPLRLHYPSMGSSEVLARTAAMLDEVGIPDARVRMRAYPHQLSGGMRQRVMIAMALICGPRLLIADEPTTALDVTIQAQVLEKLGELQRNNGTAVLLITHDLGVVAQTSNHVNVMYAGQIVESGDVYRIFDSPLHPYTRALLRSMPSSSAGRGKLYSIEGTVPSLRNMPSGCRFAPRCPDAGERCVAVPEIADIGGSHLVRCWRATA